jgi:hypothetical protein
MASGSMKLTGAGITRRQKMTDTAYTAGGRPDWKLVPEHMREGVKIYIERGIPPGDFLTAVIQNDLKEACGRADEINARRIWHIVNFFYNYAPIDCWGSPGKMAAWIEQGGLYGK